MTLEKNTTQQQRPSGSGFRLCTAANAELWRQLGLVGSWVACEKSEILRSCIFLQRQKPLLFFLIIARFVRGGRATWWTVVSLGGFAAMRSWG